MKRVVFAAVLLSLAGSLFAQGETTSAAPAASAASAPTKHKLLRKLKPHRPASAAVNPEASPDKKGGA